MNFFFVNLFVLFLFFSTATKNFDKTVDAFKKEASGTAAAVEIEKKRAIGYRLLLDSLRKKKEQDQRQMMVWQDCLFFF